MIGVEELATLVEVGTTELFDGITEELYATGVEPVWTAGEIVLAGTLVVSGATVMLIVVLR